MLSFFLVCFISLSTAFATPMVAVLEFSGIGIEDDVLNQLSDSVRVAARDALPVADYDLMTRENMMRILEDNEIDPSCIEGACEVDTGRNIGADLIIAGQLRRLEGQNLLTLKLYDTDSGKLLSGQKSESGSVLELDHQAEAATRALLGKGLGIKDLISAPSAAQPSYNFGGGVGGNVQQMLRQKQCRTEAAVQGKGQRQAKLEPLVEEARTAASSAWSAMQADLQSCLQLDSSQRDPCIVAVEEWIAAAEKLTVTLPSGIETIRGDCGVLEEAYTADTVKVVPAELAAAKMMRSRLKQRSQSRQSESSSSGDFQAHWFTASGFSSTLIVASGRKYEPMFNLSNPNAPTGFDIDIAEELARRLGKSQVRFVPTSSARLAAKRGEADFAIAAISITSKRQAIHLFSDPYFRTGQVMVFDRSGYGCGSTTSLRHSGKRCGYHSPLYKSILRKQGCELVKYRSSTAVMNALRAGQIDFFIVEEQSAPPEFCSSEVISSDSYGIVFPNQSVELKQQVDRHLRDMQRSGFIAETRAKYGID